MKYRSKVDYFKKNLLKNSDEKLYLYIVITDVMFL